MKRITMILGHYGSGKTNIAVNLAVAYRREKDNVAIADLDIVNPYFRTKDSLDLLQEKGIRLIVSEYANSNVDIPALPQDMYAVTDDKTLTCILDIGGDDRGALVLGRLRPEIVKENIKKKFQDEKLPLVDEVIELDKQKRAAQQEADELKALKNKSEQAFWDYIKANNIMTCTQTGLYFAIADTTAGAKVHPGQTARVKFDA